MQSDDRKAPGWAAAVVILLMAVLSHWLLQRASPAQIEALPPGSPLAAVSPLAAPAPAIIATPTITGTQP